MKATKPKNCPFTPTSNLVKAEDGIGVGLTASGPEVGLLLGPPVGEAVGGMADPPVELPVGAAVGPTVRDEVGTAVGSGSPKPTDGVVVFAVERPVGAEVELAIRGEMPASAKSLQWYRMLLHWAYPARPLGNSTQML